MMIFILIFISLFINLETFTMKNTKCCIIYNKELMNLIFTIMEANKSINES